MIRIAMVGAGAIARFRHFPAFQKMPDVQVAVVCNRTAESAAAVAAEYRIPETSALWQDVVARPDIDVVWIGTTPHLHAPVAIAALDAGKHVFCQGRLAMNLDEALAMLAAAGRNPKQVAMICPPPTAMKHGVYFEKLLRDQTIGRVLHFHLRALTSVWADPAAPAHWRQRRELSGNNIMSVGIYGEVLGRFLGDPLALAAQGRVVYEDRGGYRVTVPDCVQAIGKWPGEVEGTLAWSGVAHAGGHEVLEIYGTAGTLAYDFNTDEISLGRPGDSSLSPVPVPPEFIRTWTVEEDYLRAVREGTRIEPTFQTGVRYMRFVEAITRAMAERSWIRLEP